MLGADRETNSALVPSPDPLASDLADFQSQAGSPFCVATQMQGLPRVCTVVAVRLLCVPGSWLNLKWHQVVRYWLLGHSWDTARGSLAQLVRNHQFIE